MKRLAIPDCSQGNRFEQTGRVQQLQESEQIGQEQEHDRGKRAA